MEELISVLLPVYNAEFSLAACLDSILNQSHPRFEVIAVDDGSIDSSAAILSRYAASDPRIKLFRFTQNRGIVAALNFGLEHCLGGWIARMDADDRMRPGRLQHQLQYLNDHPDIDILGSRINLFRYQGELTPGQKEYRDWSNGLLSDDQIKANIFAESPIMHPTFFLKREVYRKLGGYLDHPWAEDYDLLLRAYLENLHFAKTSAILLDKGDHPSRLARTDYRCKRTAMFQAKAYYFAQKASRWQTKKRFWIVGINAASRMLFQALTHIDFRIDGFIDLNQRSPDDTFLGKPVLRCYPGGKSRQFGNQEESFYLVTVDAEENRQMVEKLFQDLGLNAGQSYLRFI